MNTYYIYAAIDPRDRRIRYVGCSMRPENRMRCIEAYRQWQAPRDKWMAELKKLGLKPDWCVLDSSDAADTAARLELEWIRRLRAAGVDLLNGIGEYRYTPRNRRRTGTEG